MCDVIGAMCDESTFTTLFFYYNPSIIMRTILIICCLLISTSTFAQQATYPWVNPDRNTRTHPPIAIPNAPSSSQSPNTIAMPAATIAAPAGFEAHCILHDDVTHFFVMPNGTILGRVTGSANWEVVGVKTAPPTGRTEFAYMIKLNHTTYAVDTYGHVWEQQYPFRQIVGRIAAVNK